MKELISQAIRKPLLFCIIALVASSLLLAVLKQNPVYSNEYKQAYFLQQSGDPAGADAIFAVIAKRDPSDLQMQRIYILNHFDIPKIISQSKYSSIRRDDHTIYSYYSELLKDSSAKVQDVARYCLGLISASQKDHFTALFHYRKVKNRNMKYLHNSIGVSYMNLDSNLLAEKEFRTEIINRGFTETAVNNLGRTLLAEKKITAYDSLLHTLDGFRNLSSSVKRIGYFRLHLPLQYFAALFSGYASDFTWWGAIAAFLIMAGWIMYLRKLDVFEKEKWSRIIIVACMGMIFTLLVYPITDLLNLTFGFKLNGHFGNDALYCVFGIGAVEEMCKIIPVLIMLRLSKGFNEPYDYIKFASISALGFAFAENLEYFREGNTHIIHGRAITAAVHHMFNSSIIAYGMLQNRYRWNRNPVLVFIGFFLLASLSHGFYDFWLVSKSTNGLSMITILFLFFCINFWNVMLNNALSNSSFFSEELTLEQQPLKAFLLFTLVGVLIFEYAAEGIQFGPTAANRALFTSLKGGTYLLLFISARLSAFRLRKGEWRSITQSVSANELVYRPIIGARASFRNISRQETIRHFFPCTGIIEKEFPVQGKQGWFLAKLDSEAKDQLHDKFHVLIRAKEVEDQLYFGINNQIAVYAIPNSVNVTTMTGDEKFSFLGWGIVQLVEADHSAGSR